MKKKILGIGILALILLTTACAEKKDPAEVGGQVHYIITQNYGAEMIVDSQVAYRENSSIMDGLLLTGAKIETAYEGSFIDGINGLKSNAGGLNGERYDWFYYVNGLFADCGALDYLPQPGEKIWWDYHAWKTSKGTPAVIGCFPEPFVHGYRGQVNATVILATEAAAQEAKELQTLLLGYGVQEVEIRKLAEQALQNRTNPTIVVGEWPELQKLAWLREFNEDFQVNGTYVQFQDDKIAVLDYTGQISRETKGQAGAIVAAGEGNGDENPLWII
ncbi:MAG: DUF4430 domain-containing protein, partial [Desulfocucumaceae bacterium]